MSHQHWDFQCTLWTFSVIILLMKINFWCRFLQFWRCYLSSKTRFLQEGGSLEYLNNNRSDYSCATVVALQHYACSIYEFTWLTTHNNPMMLIKNKPDKQTGWPNDRMDENGKVRKPSGLSERFTTIWNSITVAIMICSYDYFESILTWLEWSQWTRASIIQSLE